MYCRNVSRPLSLHVTNSHHHCQILHHWLPFSYRNAEKEREMERWKEESRMHTLPLSAGVNETVSSWFDWSVCLATA